jgi:polysaccharide chain length determinant protein (PEP-CTERM system associated)
VFQYLEILIRRRWAVIVPAVVIGGLTVLIVFSIPATYQSTTLILVEAQKVPETLVRTTVTTPIEDRLQAISQQILSRTRLQRVIEKFDLYQSNAPRPEGWIAKWWERFRYGRPAESSSAPVTLDHVERLRRNIDIQVPRGRNPGSIISIAFIGADPRTVMDVTNELASLFIEENLRVREAQAEGTTEFLENELQQMKVRLEAHEEALRSFKERSMGELPEQLETNLRTLDRLQIERQMLENSLKNAEDRYADLSRQLTGDAPGGGGSPSTGAGRLQALRTRLANLRTEYTEEYPDIVSLKKEIAAVEADLAAQTTTSTLPDMPGGDAGNAQLAEQRREIQTIRQRQQVVVAQIKDYEKRVERTPHREQQLAMVLRDYENVRRSYQTLLDKRQEAKIAESLERRQKAEIFRVLDPANFPERPYQPNRPLLILLGIAGGLVAGIGLAVFREQLDASIKTEADLVEASTGIPMLAVVPFVAPRAGKKPMRIAAAPKTEVKRGR